LTNERPQVLPGAFSYIEEKDWDGSHFALRSVDINFYGDKDGEKK